MLKQIRIQNFKSIKDITLDLEQVNLFIGPNNSGKSNVLKALEFFSEIVLKGEIPRFISENSFKKIGVFEKKPMSISYILNYSEDLIWVYKLEILSDNEDLSFVELAFLSKNVDLNLSNLSALDILSWSSYFDEGKVTSNNFSFNHLAKSFYKQTESIDENSLGLLILKEHRESSNIIFKNEQCSFGAKTKRNKYFFLDGIFQNFLTNWIIYKPDVRLIQSPNIENKENLPLDYLEKNCYNLAEFLFNFSQNHKKEYSKFLEDFKLCVHEFVDISIPYDPNDKTKSSLKIKFFDDLDFSYWIDEVSDGVIYFLALLAIIHQPNHPMMLMLEEPETGIHPRRIKEIIDYIFKLAYEKNIQVILTSHSPLVLNKFSSSPQSVTVFDKENGETKIKNLLKDIIDVSNAKQKEAGVSEINYTSSLSEYWIDGFIGGIPDEND